MTNTNSNKTATDRFVWGTVIHLIADWLLQNQYMSDNKSNPKHPAGYIHAMIHTVGLLWVFPYWVAFLIGSLHWLIDLRFILRWWRKTFKQTTDGDAALHVAIWGDQVTHLAVIALFAKLMSWRKKL